MAMIIPANIGIIISTPLDKYEVDVNELTEKLENKTGLEYSKKQCDVFDEREVAQDAWYSKVYSLSLMLPLGMISNVQFWELSRQLVPFVTMK